MRIEIKLTDLSTAKDLHKLKRKIEFMLWNDGIKTVEYIKEVVE